jgi:integral membrane protein (TIGR01906 family)
MKIPPGLVTLSIPLMLIVGVIRLLLTPAFVRFEYQLPHFPPDQYGFSADERLAYAQLSRRYLVTDAGIDVLEDLRFEDGSALFNPRELRHMKDVKGVVRGAFLAGYISTFVFLFGVIWAWVSDQRGRFKRSVFRGGWVTVLFLCAVLLLSVVGFQALFVIFHKVFFEGETWIFRYSDTLIRLFPMRFWRDAFLVFGVLTAGSGCLVAFLFRERDRSE